MHVEHRIALLSRVIAGGQPDRQALVGQADEFGLNATPWVVDTGQRDFKNGYAYGIRW